MTIARTARITLAVVNSTGRVGSPDTQQALVSRAQLNLTAR